MLPGLAPRLRDFSPHPLNPWLPAAGGWGEPKAPVPASAPSAATSPPWLRPAPRLRASPRLSLCHGGTVSRSPTSSDCEPPSTRGEGGEERSARPPHRMEEGWGREEPIALPRGPPRCQRRPHKRNRGRHTPLPSRGVPHRRDKPGRSPPTAAGGGGAGSAPPRRAQPPTAGPRLYRGC